MDCADTGALIGEEDVPADGPRSEHRGIDTLPTQQSPWMQSAARHLAPRGALQTVGSECLPLGGRGMPMLQTDSRPRRLSLVGAALTGEPGDLAWVTEASLDALAQCLAQQPLAVDLPRVPANSPTVAALKRAFAGRGLVHTSVAEGTPFIDLDGSWGDPHLKFNAGRRSDFRRGERHAEKLGGLAFELHERTDGPALDRLLDEAFAVEAQSWKGEAGSALLHDPVLGPFFRDYAHAAMRAGILRLALMRVGGQAVGMQLAVQTAQRFWLLKIGYDHRYARCMPGNLLMLHTIAHAARQGLRSYEFLGSAAPWTLDWTQTLRPCVRVRAYPASVPGTLALAQDLLASGRSRLAFLWSRARGRAA